MAAGHTVTGWNRSRDKAEALIKDGMGWADTPRQVAAQSDIVFSIVTDAQSGESGCARSGRNHIGTEKRRHLYRHEHDRARRSRAVAAEFAKAGSIMLDGPLSGSPVTVKAGNASVMIGGDEARSSG